MNARLSRYLSSGFLHAALILIAVVWLVPTIGLFVTSWRPRPDIFGSGWWMAFSTFRFTAENYIEVLTAQGLARNFLNSFAITIPGTLLPVLIGALAAYGFAWLKFPGRDWIFLIIVGLLVVPIQMTFVPALILARGLKLTNSLLGIWLAHTAYGLPFAIFLLRNFFAALPRDLVEAAKMDGASDLGVFWRIVLPLSVPAIASLSIFQFLWVWNDLLTSLIFVQDPNLLPMTVSIAKLLSTYGTEWHLLSAGSFILMAVPLVIFFSLQRYFVQGILAGSVK
jgi:alpha-glucoside transport system permease protein